MQPFFDYFNEAIGNIEIPNLKPRELWSQIMTQWEKRKRRKRVLVMFPLKKDMTIE